MMAIGKPRIDSIILTISGLELTRPSHARPCTYLERHMDSSKTCSEETQISVQAALKDDWEMKYPE